MFGEFIKSADFKTEKHQPVIHVADTVKAGEAFDVEVLVGEDIAHPNTVEHHIAWIKLYFIPEGTKNPFEVASSEFRVHGDAAAGAEGVVTANPKAKVSLTLQKGGTFYAVSYCNIHGLWAAEKTIVVE